MEIRFQYREVWQAGRVTLCCFVETKQTTDAREMAGTRAARKKTSHRVVGRTLSGEAA